MRLSIPLSLLRIWCRKTDSWLCFQTKLRDRYFVGSLGYFIEFPDGSLAPIRPRTVFPAVDRFPSVLIGDINVQAEFGREALFITVPATGPREGKPRGIHIDEISSELEGFLPELEGLDPLENYVLLRLFESGYLQASDIERGAQARVSGLTLGEALIQSGICAWEFMLALCLDTPSPSKLDPPSMRTLAQRREWELTGEMLVALGKLSRTNLEEALRIKREGSQALGQILTSMGACSQEDIDECLKVQKEIRQSCSSEVALIGQLLVGQGIISHEDFDDAMRSQKTGRQSLERIFLSMGVCSEADIAAFVETNNWHSFQAEIDDLQLGEWLVKRGQISRQQFDEALRIQLRGRQVLGEMLVSMQLCSPRDIEAILSLQKSMREDYQTGIEKLGALLLKKGKISSEHLEEALKLQSIGRQPIGCILTAMGFCSADDVKLTLELQQHWREKERAEDDRLGEVLVARGVLPQETLDEILPYHFSEGRPLGRILIERMLCTPEQIIDALIARDHQRHKDFLRYLRTSTARQPAGKFPALVADETLDSLPEEEYVPRPRGWKRPTVEFEGDLSKVRSRAAAPPLKDKVYGFIDRLSSWLFNR